MNVYALRKRRPTAFHAITLTHTIEILQQQLGMDSEEIKDVLSVLNLKGGCCDCEILYNVAEESRLKANYWNNHER